MPEQPHNRDPTEPADAAAPQGPCARWKDAPLVREIFVVNNLMTRVGDRLVGDLGLTASRWQLLGVLNDYERAPTLTELSADALLSVQNVSRMVAAMERDGLLERASAPGAGRAVFVRPTGAGDELRERACERAARFTEAFLAGLSAEEIAVVQGALDRMMSNLERFERELASEGAAPQAARSGSEDR